MHCFIELNIEFNLKHINWYIMIKSYQYIFKKIYKLKKFKSQGSV